MYTTASTMVRVQDVTGFFYEQKWPTIQCSMCLNILRTHWRLFVPFSPSKMLHPVKRLKELFSPNTKKKGSHPRTFPPPKKTTNHTANQTQLPPPTSKPRKHIPASSKPNRATGHMADALPWTSPCFRHFRPEVSGGKLCHPTATCAPGGWRSSVFLSMDVCVWQYNGLKKLQGRPIRNKRPNAINEW